MIAGSKQTFLERPFFEHNQKLRKSYITFNLCAILTFINEKF